MVQQLQIERLLNTMIEKSELYFGIGDLDECVGFVPFSGSYAKSLQEARAEWKAAELAYKSAVEECSMHPITLERTGRRHL